MNQIEKKIDFWIKNNQNVLFIGKHGTGKTSIVKDAFEKNNLNYRYFSASTMDPWVDFVGVPKENTDNKTPDEINIVKELAKINLELAEEWVVNNWKLSIDSAKKVVQHSINRDQGLTYLELIRPYSFASGEVEALFFDEFNRSPKKVRNAVMELLQFKSINGFKFPKLRLIWAAINPEDEDQTYDVEKLDPAQKDRFHVSIEVPYSPNTEWFRKEYGKRMADSAIQWWAELPEEEKDKVSPRRLQYALDTYRNKGDIRDILPSTSNVSKLHSVLASGPTLEKLDELIKNKNDEETRSFLSNENNYASAIKYILKSDYFQDYFLPLIPKEKISVLLSESDSATLYIVKNCNRVPVFKQICEEIIKANTNTKLIKKLKKTFTELQAVNAAVNQEKIAKPWKNLNDIQNIVSATPQEELGDTSNISPPFFNSTAVSLDWQLELDKMYSSLTKVGIIDFQSLEENIPSIMTGKQAAQCLEILSNVFLDEVLHTNNLQNLVPVINHCIIEGCKNRSRVIDQMSTTNEDWIKSLVSDPVLIDVFFKDNLNIIRSLFAKLKSIGLIEKVIKTEKQLIKYNND